MHAAAQQPEKKKKRKKEKAGGGSLTFGGSSAQCLTTVCISMSEFCWTLPALSGSYLIHLMRAVGRFAVDDVLGRPVRDARRAGGRDQRWLEPPASVASG